MHLPQQPVHEHVDVRALAVTKAFWVSRLILKTRWNRVRASAARTRGSANGQDRFANTQILARRSDRVQAAEARTAPERFQRENIPNQKWKHFEGTQQATDETKIEPVS